MNMDEFNQDQATSEGWCIAEVYNHSTLPDGWMRIEKLDATGMFDSDYAAIAYVAAKAANGSRYHAQAIEYVERENSSREG